MSLPPPLLNEIFSYLSIPNLTKRVFLVCKDFKKIGDGEIQWKERAIRVYGEINAAKFFSKITNWKLVFISGPSLEVTQKKQEQADGHFRGKRMNADRSIEEGEFQNYVHFVKGKRIEADGTIFEGEFKNHKLTGIGKVMTPNGDIWEGEFKDNTIDGWGKVTSSNGVVFEGKFIKGDLCDEIKKYPDGPSFSN